MEGSSSSNYSQLEKIAKKNDSVALKINEQDEISSVVFTIIIIYEKEKGNIYEEEFIGNGKTLTEAKENTASKVLKRSSTLQSVKHGRHYQCHPNQTGYVLVICFTKNREGAEQDVERIKSFMEKEMRFYCKVVFDPTKEKLIEILKETAGVLNTDHRKYFCFISFIMGHGGEEGISVCDERMKVEDIVGIFHNDKMKKFTGKPKAFFVQCCRGGARHETTVQTDYDADNEEIGNVEVPNDGDIFIAYATTKGKVSYRDTMKGSFFIFNCIETFKKSYNRMHLEEMMIDVKADIALYLNVKQSNTSNKKLAQMPCTWSTLTKRFYLNPNYIPNLD